MKFFLLFFLVFLFTISSVSAGYTWPYAGYGLGVGGGASGYGKLTHYSPQSNYIWSGVANYNYNGRQTGTNPFYATTTPYSRTWNPTLARSHINRNDALSNELYKHPELFAVRYSSNYQNSYRGLNPYARVRGNTYTDSDFVDKGIFYQYNTPYAKTGRITSNYDCVFC